MTDSPPARALLVFDGTSWFVRHVRAIEHDTSQNEKVYYCDFPISGPHEQIQDAVAALQDAMITRRRGGRRLSMDVIVASLALAASLGLSEAANDLVVKRRPRRKHSKNGQVRCDICAPARCVKANGGLRVVKGRGRS